MALILSEAIFLAAEKYGFRKVRLYPTECGEQLGRDPSKHGSSKSLVLKSFFFPGREHFGTRPCLSPPHVGIPLYFVRPHSPLLIFKDPTTIPYETINALLLFEALLEPCEAISMKNLKMMPRVCWTGDVPI